MIRVLAAGVLIGEPVSRISVKGSPFATFTVRSESRAESCLISCITFDDLAVAEVVQLHKGDSISVAGKCELRSWTGKDGTENTGLSVIVDRLITASATKPAKRAKTTDSPKSDRLGSPQSDLNRPAGIGPYPTSEPLTPWPAGTVDEIPSDKPF